MSVFDQAVFSGTSFVSSVMIGRLCSQQELGLYYLALSIVFFVMGVQAELVTSPYIVFCHKFRGQRRATYSASVFVHQIVISGFTGISLLLVAALVSVLSATEGLIPVIWILLVAAPFVLMRAFLRQFSFAHLTPGVATTIDITVAVFQIGGLALLWSMSALTVPFALVVSGGACAIAFSIGFFMQPEPLRLDRTRIVPDWFHNWDFARWALASQLIGCSTPFLVPWIVLVVRGEASTGVLAACTAVAGVANMFVTGVANFLTAQAAKAFSRGGVHALTQVLWRTAFLFVAALGAFCLMTGLAGDWLMTTVYGELYAGTGFVVSLLAGSILFTSMGLVAGNGLWAVHHPRANLTADVVQLVATVAAVLALVFPGGVPGVAAGILIGAALGAIVRCLTLREVLRTL